MLIPSEVLMCLQDLEAHYCDFEPNDGGANAFLWFAKNRISQAEVAIKFYAGEPGDRRHDEPRLLSTIESPNVLQIYDARDVSTEWAYFITPRCRGGDLDDLIKTRPSVHDAIDVVLGITHGVSALHVRGMVHRDLKPANIVIDGGRALIADFGSVRVLGLPSGETSASHHSILYRPPESFATKRYNRSGDVYQIGLIAYQVLGGALPYEGTEYFSARQRKEYLAIESPIDQSLFVDSVIRRRAQAGTLLDLSSLPPWISHGAKRVLGRMTNPDPAQRLTSVAEVAVAMSNLRGSLRNWRYVGETAQLVILDRVIELRPSGKNQYEAFQCKQGNFRRVPGMEPSTLADLVQRCSR